ncbi:MAG: NAD+ synthase [Actinomycetota bacterium]
MEESTLRVAIAQIPNRVGDLAGNTARIAAAMDWAEEEGAAVLVLPELALTGYGLRDLVLHRAFVAEAAEALDDLAGRSGRTTTVVGTVDRVPPRRSWDTRDRTVAICAALLCDGEVRGKYHKVLLPSYDLFDEARLFAPGARGDLTWRIGDVVAGVAICEDLWSPDGPPEAQSAAGARILLAPNASPFHRGKAEGRLSNTRAVAVRNGFPVVYVNFVGGQDELAFDGGSIVVGGDGALLARGREFEEDRFVIEVPVAPPRPVSGAVHNVHTRPTLRPGGIRATHTTDRQSDVAAVWQAIVVTLRDYVERNGYKGVALGLSGGIDSSVTAALAVDAVGADRVLALAMPSPETPPQESESARQVAADLGIQLEEMAVESSDGISEPRASEDATATAARERAYARARAAVLGDFAEERGYLVLATGNKSEISIGAASLYGDLAGGFAPLKDCPKTLVYALADLRNGRGKVFPSPTVDRSRAGHRLRALGVPSYQVLDDLVQRYVEYGQDPADMVSAGHDPELVELVLGRIDDAELVRRYAPPGVKVTSRAFDQDRRMPISNSWRAHLRK